jgi:hypothetical protein
MKGYVVFPGKLENSCKKLKYCSGKDSVNEKRYGEGCAMKPGPEMFHEDLFILLQIRQGLNKGILHLGIKCI